MYAEAPAVADKASWRGFFQGRKLLPRFQINLFTASCPFNAPMGVISSDEARTALIDFS
jgi:hypothetical protein